MAEFEQPDEVTGDLDPKLRSELQAALSGRLETSLTLEQALNGDKGAVVEMWRQIAANEANIAEKDIWVTKVAADVMRSVVPAAHDERPTTALDALGLRGRLDRHWGLRRALEIWNSFPRNGHRRVKRAELTKWMQDRGFLAGRRPAAAAKVIDRILERLPPEGRD